MNFDLANLVNLVEEYENTGNVTLWNNNVVPLLASIATATGSKQRVVKEAAYRILGFGVEQLATDAELAAFASAAGIAERGLLQRMMARAAAAGIGPQDAMPVIALAMVGIALISTAKEASAAPNLSGTKEYQKYFTRYMHYIIRNTQMRGRVMLPPPITYKNWRKGDHSGGWWL